MRLVAQREAASLALTKLLLFYFLLFLFSLSLICSSLSVNSFSSAFLLLCPPFVLSFLHFVLFLLFLFSPFLFTSFLCLCFPQCFLTLAYLKFGFISSSLHLSLSLCFVLFYICLFLPFYVFSTSLSTSILPSSVCVSRTLVFPRCR